MLPLTFLNSFLLSTFFLSTLCSLTTTAPTHHLTIGVQGNTPTLMVTSSEIDIIPETPNPNKKFSKTEFLVKPQERGLDFKSNEKLKSLKQKVLKNQSLYNKKEKLQYFAKPTPKHVADGEATTEKMESPTRENNRLKHHKEYFEHEPTTATKQTEKLKQIDNIIAVTFKKKEQKLKIIVDSSSEQQQTINDAGDRNRNTFIVTNQDLKDSEASSILPTKSIPALSTTVITEKPDIPTIRTFSTPKVEVEHEDISSTIATTTTDVLEFKKFEDISTATNYVATLNTATTSEGLKSSSALKEISTSDKKSTTARQITEETTTIKTENDNDRTTENPTTLKNGNLLLTITPAMTIADTASSPPTLFDTLIPDNAAATTTLPLFSISLTTSGNDVDDNEQNATETSETATNMEKADNDVDGKAESADTRSIHGDNSKSVKFKQELAYLSPTSAKPTILSHTRAKTMTTEIPLPFTTVQTMEDFQINGLENEQSVIKTATDMETTVPTTSIPFTEQKKQQQQSTTEISMDPLEITTNFRVSDLAANTEKVLKLIDLEKHVAAADGELKQPSLTVGSRHENGHDGLKYIKKKQLIDKHYIEDLLLNKQDDNHESENLQQENVTDTAAAIVTALSNSTTSFSPLTKAANTSHLLVPIKHGYLGPILMEEKTFHVIHHAVNNNNGTANKTQSLSSLVTKLRTGHFVELKAQPAASIITSIHNKTEALKSSLQSIAQSSQQKFIPPVPEIRFHNNFKNSKNSSLGSSVLTDSQPKSATVLSSTLFQIVDTVATKTPLMQANTFFTSEDRKQTKEFKPDALGIGKTESKISDIQIEVYDSTIDSIVGSTNFKDSDNNPTYLKSVHDEFSHGKTTKPPISSIQQEKFTQYVIDRTETSTQESINISKIQVASGKPEPAAIEIHINVSESFGNESEDLEFSYPQADFNNNERVEDESYDDSKVNDNIKLKVPSNGGSNSVNKEARSDEILVVEIIDTDNTTEQTNRKKIKNSDDLFISDHTPPPPPPPPPYQSNFDRDSDTIFYISNTEVKVGESLASSKLSNEERKLKLESQFFPANYMASTHPNMNTKEDSKFAHHLYEEDIILSSNSNRNQADSLKIYRNRNEPSPPLDVTYVGESIIEVEQSPDSIITTTYVPDQQHLVTQQADVIIQPAILPEISIGVPVIGELPPQIELKEIDFMPNEPQLHRSGIYEENYNNNNIYNNDIEDITINAGSTGYSYNHDVDNNNNINNNQRLDESSIQYGGDLIDESADGGFDGVEGSYPFGNPAAAAAAASSSGTTKIHKHQPNHVADYAHLYVNYGVNNMRKDELSVDVKDSGELIALGVGGGSSASVNSNEQNITSFKEFLSKVSMNNSSYINGNFTQTERVSNATAFSLMEDANDLQEKSTADIVNLISLAIGLFIVILPVVVTCSMFWALRYLYNKYHANVTDSSGYSDQTDTKGQMNEDGVEKGELIHDLPSSSPTNSDKDAKQKFPETSNNPSTTDRTVKISTDKSTHLDQTTFSQTDSASSASKAKYSLHLSLALETHTTEIHTVHDEIEMAGPNGSVTKMTMENNLLIVETEERNDISRVARETKMDYNRDGVFVVEVARGIDSKTIPGSPVTEDSEKMLSVFETKHSNGTLGYKIANEKKFVNNEKVQIHSPPPENSTEDGPRSLHQIEEVDEPINSPHCYGEVDADIIAGLAYKSQAGLSQSDLSTTSSNDSNKGYCYGNQALYVVEQSGYSTMSPMGNVVLKCDSKDIKDDDSNPENDHYLKHSPDKTEERRDKEDFVETFKKQENSTERTGLGMSPQPKQNDKEKEREQTAITYNDVKTLNVVNIEIEQLNISENTSDDENLPSPSVNNICKNKDHPIEATLHSNSANNKPMDCVQETIPREYTTPVDLDISVEIPATENPSLPIDSLSPFKSSNTQELLLSDEIISNAETSLSAEPLYKESSSQGDLPFMVETEVSVEENITNRDSILAVPKKFSDNKTNNGMDNEIHNGNEKTLALDDVLTEIVAEKELKVLENGFAFTEKITLELNGIVEKPANGMRLDEDSRTENKLNLLAEDKITVNGLNQHTHMKTLENGSETFHDKVTELESLLTQNAETDSEPPSNFLTDMENGYDSIMSLPEPPPTTEEQLNSDFSEQQLDSLPPPPPPEIFNLKDLPPPQTNGDADALAGEESNNFYNTLPPPPPTTLEVTATNGRMHASPLTPPASPPARFTNNLHAGLCAQPIAVDVNGS